MTSLAAASGIALGVVSAFVVNSLSRVIALRRRSINFDQHKRVSPKIPDWLPLITPPTRNAREQQRDGAMREVLAIDHAAAKVLQDQTISHLVAATTTLLAAFIVGAMSLTLWAESGLVHFAAASFDIMALILAFFAYRHSGKSRIAWLRQRSISELLRQWLTVEYLLAPEDGALTKRIDALRSKWEGEISTSAEQLIDSVAKAAYARLDELTTALAEINISDTALMTYYVARPQRQVKWFTSSLERLEHNRHFRERLMLATFLGAFVSACVKFGALLFHQESINQLAMLALLIFIGLAGASSSAYLGQNQRSLRHRYAQQLQDFKDWCATSAGDGLVLHLTSPTQSSSAAIVRDIRAFERLMVVELLEWLSISTDDAMELAPS